MNDRVISKKILDAFEVVTAQMRGEAAVPDPDIGTLVDKEMRKPSLPDEELDAALLAMPEYRAYKDGSDVAAGASFDDFIADAQRWTNVLRAGVEMKTKMHADWLAAGCPAKSKIAISAPLKLARAKPGPA
jgi:hypothetical protein